MPSTPLSPTIINHLLVKVDLDNMNSEIQKLKNDIGKETIKLNSVGTYCPIISERICVLKARLNLLEQSK